MRISGVTYASRRTHKFRNALLAILILLLAAALVIAAVSAYEGWQLLHPEKKSIGAFSSNIAPEYREVSFKSGDRSIVLSGWLFQADKSETTVILAHSYKSNRLEFGTKSIDMIKAFLRKGYNVLTFDLRDSGESGGKNVTFGSGEQDDILGAMTYAKQQGARHIVLMGFSTGASACILAAEDSKDTDAVIADSPYADLGEFMHSSLGNWTRLPALPFNDTVAVSMEVIGGLDTAEANPLASLGDMAPAGLLLIHAKNDPIIPASSSQELYKAYSRINADKAELWVTDASGHAESYLKDPAQYMDKVLAFLDKVYSK